MKNQILTSDEIVKLINQDKLFEATASDAGFKIKISKYVPFFCTAIHDGYKIRKELESKIALNEYERWFEEDPFTGKFIESLPITVIGLDSRFEYDLNRNPESCIYDEAWGKKVWKKNLSAADRAKSIKKHKNYYRVIHSLVEKIEELYGGCLVYDVHSYNFQRWERAVPLFNIGAEKINTDKFGTYLDKWVDELSSIKIENVVNKTKVNDVFYGRGYNLEYITNNFKNTLVFATEVKKVYCDELSGEEYPKIIRSLQHGLKRAIINTANVFGQDLENWQHISAPMLLHKGLDENTLKIDKALYSMLKNFELLSAVNPINTKAEKKKFFKNNFNELPKFKYKPVNINPFELKKKLFELPYNSINDVSVRSLYEAVTVGFYDKIDMIKSLDSKNFLYNSLRYFGRPSKTDLRNANYILLLPEIPGEAKKEPLFNAIQASEVFKEKLDEFGIDAKVELNSKVISQVMVLNSKRKVLVQPESTFKQKELNAMIAHEIGIHMVTTANSNLQPLKIFNLGLPVNTKTQEGLAVLSEYLSGNISLRRLKKIALRVIAVDMMSDGADFIDCFNRLVDEYNVDENDAFTIVTRIFRGGGFTKDYLYLSGFVEVLKMYEQDQNLEALLIGKTSTEFYSTIEEMMGRGMVEKPKFINTHFEKPNFKGNDGLYRYIFKGLV